MLYTIIMYSMAYVLIALSVACVYVFVRGDRDVAVSAFVCFFLFGGAAALIAYLAGL